MRPIRIPLVLTLAALLSFGQSQNLPRVEAAMQAVGTFSWIVHGMDTFGFDTLNGIDVVGTTYASKAAVEIALRGAEADVVVDDFLGPVVLRANGVEVTAIFPYATAIGGLVVGADSEIAGIEDLRGATIAASSLDDKSLIILRALSISQYGFDVQNDAEVLAASPPLMSQLVGNGEADAALPLWHWVARMEASGSARELMTIADMQTMLGLPTGLPNLVVVARDGLDDDLKTKFIAALTETVEHMRSLPNDDPFWQSILDLELYSLPDEAQFPAVIDRWRLGTVTTWTDAQIDGLSAMVDRLVEIAGAEVVGVDSVPSEAYSTEFVPR
ncbi:MAG: ABC transporter substrate-binding protein [Trueperaceae bacterium]